MSDPARTPPQPPAFRSHRVARCRSIADLRRAARRRLPRGVFDFVDGGAEDERTLGDNAAAYAALRFLPHVLTDVSQPSTRTTLLGAEVPLPFAIGPTGAAGFSWPGGDLCNMGAAARAGVPYALSSSASVRIEDLAAAQDALTEGAGRRWFQCYIFRSRAFTDELIGRAREAGYEALVITVDLPVGGNRERDYRNDFAVPFRYTPRNLLDFASHPAWALSTLRHGTPEMANLVKLATARDISTVASSVGRNYDASFSWDDLARIRAGWAGKLIVKGVARADDARRLVDLGADAIVVSNHGGRQLDSAWPSLFCLPEIALAVGDRAEVLVDGGIRRGSDILKALALGARAVLLGRAVLYGTAAAGPVGATRAVDILTQELSRTMQLAGIARMEDVGPHLLAPADLRRALDPQVVERLLAREAATPAATPAAAPAANPDSTPRPTAVRAPTKETRR